MKRALLAGTNYIGSRYQLNGCVNDIEARKQILIEHFNFTEIVVLLNDEATTAAIKDALLRLRAKTQPGDLIYFAWSGHGSNIPDETEEDGVAEVICPDDFNFSAEHMITDDWFREYINNYPEGVCFVGTLDSCHSGDAFRGVVGSRFIPNPETLGLRKITRPILFNDNSRKGILMAGCHSNQTSADAYIKGDYWGAFSYYLNKVLVDNNYIITYRALIGKNAELLHKNGYSQVPTLECDDDYNDTVFLGGGHE
jgi:hypothetical protein